MGRSKWTCLGGRLSLWRKCTRRTRPKTWDNIDKFLGEGNYTRDFQQFKIEWKKAPDYLQKCPREYGFPNGNSDW